MEPAVGADLVSAQKAQSVGASLVGDTGTISNTNVYDKKRDIE
jgi:hypothetical protein